MHLLRRAATPPDVRQPARESRRCPRSSAPHPGHPRSRLSRARRRTGRSQLRALLGSGRRLRCRLRRCARRCARSRRGSLRAARCGRAAVVVVIRLERDRRRAAKSLEVRDHAEDLLIGEADRRLVDRGHPRIESRHDEGVGFVQRLGEVLDIAQARDAGLRADIDPLEVGEPKRPRLADRVAGKAETLALHDLAADLDHVGRGQVASDQRSPEEAALPSAAPSGRHRHRTPSSRGRARRSGR